MLQYGLLADILNLFLIILLLAVGLSEILYRLLTKPFNELHEAMKNISKMQKIDNAYSSGRAISDEVGVLIEQYNMMIDYLEESYAQLARSEREGAWREMAKQVAHEIKNPLTPMQLKIQMLQRALRDESPDSLKPKIENTLALLLEQVDLLSRIASEFSDFAKFGEPKSSRINLVTLIYNVTRLYSSYESVCITLHAPRPFDDDTNDEVISTLMPMVLSDRDIVPIWIRADSDHLTRVFVNLLQNAIQVIGDQDDRRIDINIRLSDTKVRVDVHDNGPGIPLELRSRIFQPNFTTKSSGSGLGLALSHKIVELLGGELSFESETGQGTTFSVELLIDSDFDSDESGA